TTMRALAKAILKQQHEKARPIGRLAFGFGPRFFVLLLLGLLWLVPAWWSPRLIVAMFLWDFIILLAFVSDLLRIPKPAEIEARRSWERAAALLQPSEVTLTVRNFAAMAIRCFLIDETPVSFRSAPPVLELAVPAKERARATYQI